MDKQILDVCCGGKMFYCDKDDCRVLFCDKRYEPVRKMSNGGYFGVMPDKIHDFRNMDFKDDSFSLVIFDPPHLFCGKKSFMYTKYGTLEHFGKWKKDLAKGFSECFRVLKPAGTLIFKWCDADISLKEVLSLTPEKPVITHTAKSNSGFKNTYFCVFFKEAK
ncbi:methyltransferase, putative [Elusimicrobium minutum Pei191]|uniref:Methyltransferase, putative n=1 Tax=Elusimicrobium minutum (strain Pei191) TaxID=445932 RepID=B2KDC4_ELUMP|nr:class I SAM-dependent methyltransferase [Elusimicrobium minutum]ACC98520.1 methyltransferase, putative [Elusimicrobium minutum Pei191]